MEYPISHYFLVRAESATLAARHIERYLSGNQLISYAEFFVQAEEVLDKEHEKFWDTLGMGLVANDVFARRMLEHLKEEGATTLEDLLSIKQGYATKILHTLTHLLDGFIGIDSVFYNLVEDSHWVSEELSEAIRGQSDEYWLVPVRTGMLENSVLHPVD
ncbi:hypothetical protein JWJ90_18220 [Desulfobulbus rhabdoformis]|jgi:hypothetical protein|uniref:hypothetical protein n=1 Tax=Desulfobulbus rhabdoformis TaxID=34032 RepID=UPI0019653031|nr:hypothetical protein [Desulfobulbus rhabdoformis]MBM9616208.1 hypothetical protein [Desulfobulbus rhabdoformis]